MNCKPPQVPRSLRKPGWRIQYSEIKDKLQTGDIILVHGRYEFSWLVELLQGSRYGHCAMVVKKDDLDFDPEPPWEIPEDIFLWESNILLKDEARNVWDNNNMKDGPMLVPLRKRLLYGQNNYEDIYIAWRPLHVDRTQIQFKEILKAYFTSVIDHHFPQTEREILNSVYLGRRHNRSAVKASDILNLDIVRDIRGRKKVYDRFIDDRLEKNLILQLPEGVDHPQRKDMFCSELVGATYKALGLVTSTHVNNAYAPLDFSDDGHAPLLQRAWLGTEMYIDMCG